MKGESKSEYAMSQVALVALTLISCAIVASAQTLKQPQVKPPQPQTTEAGEPASIIVSPNDDYRIGPRDVIEVRIEDAPELSNSYSVGADGTFLMPYLKRLKAEGKTPDELSRFIADGLRGRYLKDPQVSVLVKQFYSRSFFIQGSVLRPGVYQIEGRPSLLKLITVAGGLAENHGSTAFIIRENKPKSGDPPAADPVKPVSDSQQPGAMQPPGEYDVEYSVLTVNINGLQKGRLDQNMYVEPGDIVNIPPADVFYVAGEVNAPGSFPLKEGTTLRQAVALAQGTTFNAASGDGVIFREDQATGKRLEIKVDVGAVMKGRKEDMAIQANDIVIVPNSRGKTIGNAILKAFGIATVQRGPYPR